MKYLLILLFLLVACQTPKSQAPVVNITYTDQSSLIVGDNNTPFLAPNSATEQRGEADAAATAKKTENYWWFIILLAVGVLCAGGLYAYKKGWIKCKL